MRAARSGLIAAATFFVAALCIAAGTLALAAAGAKATEPAVRTSLPDSAFAPVTVPLSSPDAPAPSSDAPSPRLVFPDVPVIRDPALSAPSKPLERAQPVLPDPKLVMVVKPKPVPVVPKTTHVISGAASWYCRSGVSPCTNDHPDDGGIDAYAAAGPRLRAAIGTNWRGQIVYVDGLRVKLIDWCQCYKGESHEKLLDLYYDVFARTGSAVRVRW